MSYRIDRVVMDGHTIENVIRLSDGAFIPRDSGNVDWIEFQAWRAAHASGAEIAPLPPTAADIVRERNRRLAMGFIYDFGDSRGAHHIGTSPADMTGWAEVSTYAGALLAHNDVTTTMAIVTETGPVEVTALEWRAIEIAAAAYRQPIWARSFVLQHMLPINYTDDEQWP